MVEKVSSYARKDLQFFKVFLPEFSSRELVIPPAFIDILEKPLPNEVSLRDEIGRSWFVDTETEDTDERLRVVFKQGWKLFAEDQSLEFGDFLVFSYDGRSRFSVTIFAKDGCKKDLGFVTATDRSTRVSADEREPERRVKRNRHSEWVDIEPEYVSTIKTEPERHRKVNQAGGSCDIPVPEKKRRVFEEPVISKPKNPHFVRNISHCTLYKLDIPTTFLKSNGIELEKEVELCDEDGKKWPMEIVHHEKGFRFSHVLWKRFFESHKLMTNNKCIFEFIVASNGRCNEIQVRIVRGPLLTTMTKSYYHVLAL
ncbi:unnamed protein product [Microthlaspi erraticum]|uniref:TF-B3 domain-containing protein n=1 Tax=Microthlaspi erraticum TaxID=1685480 RepID=A0A6D2KWP0_9BRAS|nr:unnamed protein product [Microthlaspi erraticum]